MLSIEPSTNALAALRYFRENLALQDYYCEKATVIGKWHGKSAEMLGLKGEVNSKDFEALLFNINPVSGKRLTARNSAKRRPMYDCTFSAPKSVSIIYGLTGDKKVLEAHQDAVKKAMAELEANVQTQVGTGKAKHYETTGNVLYAEFIHDTSRPLAQELESGKALVPDPQLHSHCILINATWFDDQNRFRAIEMGNVKGQASYFEALYHSYLALNLTAAGYAIVRTGKRWEIAGITRDIIEKYSGRTLRIEKVAKERGIKSAKAKARLGRLTRNDKNSDVQDGQVRDIWRDRLSLTEYHAIVNAKRYNGDGNGDNSSGGTSISAKKAMDLSLNHYLERNSAIPEKRVLAYAIDLASGILPPEAIKKELSARENIIKATRRSVDYLTTKQMVQQEEHLVEQAVAGKAIKPALNANYEIKTDWLNEGQRRAITHVLGSKDRLIMLSGDAGVGKTTLLQEVKYGIEQKGKKLFAFAPSADAARSVLRSKGFENSETIAKLLQSEKLQNELQGNVMLIDEAGLVGVDTANKLLELANKQDARIIFSGDWKQHSSVEAGDAMKILETKTNMEVARVKEIVRQRNAENYRQVIGKIAKSIGIKHDPDLRQEGVTKAFEQLDKAGNVIEINHLDERKQKIAEDYIKEMQASKGNVIVISPTHQEGSEITQAIRGELRKHEVIAPKDKEFERLQKYQFTHAEKQLGQSYAQGDVIVFNKNIGGFKAGKQYQFQGRNGNENVIVKGLNDKGEKVLPFYLHETFDIYKPEKIGIAKGDKIRMTRNTKSVEGHDLFNGQSYEVKGFDKSGNMKLSNGRVLSKDAKHFNYGYCTTSHASQGKDAETVLIAQSSSSLAASNDKQFYVSISRGTENCRVYTDDKEALKRAVAKPGDRITAQEVAQAAATLEQRNRVSKSSFSEKVRQYYEVRVKPTFENLKDQYGPRRVEKEMGLPQLGRSR